MGASYAETFAYDLVVVFFVAIVMPISVLLLRSNTAAGKLSGATLLGLSVLYVGGFEHYRLHAPEVRPQPRCQRCHIRARCSTADTLRLGICDDCSDAARIAPAGVGARARHAAGVRPGAQAAPGGARALKRS